MFRKTIRWLLFPSPSANIDLKIYKLLMKDSLGIGISNTAAPFLTMFLVQLGANDFQVGLISAMPAFVGFLLVIFIGNFIQNTEHLTKWASIAILLTYSAYFWTGTSAFFVRDNLSLVKVILIIWALITIPQIFTGVSYPTILRKAAGDLGRFELTTRRWALIGLITTLGTSIVGEILENTQFPLNFQLSFIVLSLGGLICFFSIRKISFPSEFHDQKVQSPFSNILIHISKVKSEKDFILFIIKRFVYFLGATLVAPVISLYYLREVQASPRWIGYFSTISMASLIIGYFFWLRTSRRLHSKKILLITIFCVSIYPALLSITSNHLLIMIMLAFVGFFQAGIDLVFFDELMKIIPKENSAIFISFNMLLQYFANSIGPILGTSISSTANLRFALIFGSSIKLLAFILFLVKISVKKQNEVENG